MSIGGGRTLRNAAFPAGLGVCALVLGPWWDACADRSLTWHMAQHLALAMAAAPLLALGAPLRRLLAALPRSAARRLAASFDAAPLAWLASPVSAWLLLSAVMYGAHYSGLYEAALDNGAVHAFEHALFLGSALIFWQPILGVAPIRRPLPYPGRILYVFLAMPMSAFLGLTIYTSSRPLYPHYEAALGAARALRDQQAAGELMWLCGGAIMFFALLTLVAAWGAREQRATSLAER